MAKEDRKSSRSFNLDKGEKRSFDLDKKSTRTFDLSKDIDEGNVTTPPIPKATPKPQPNGGGNSGSDNETDGQKSKKWIWIIIALIAIAVAIWGIRQCGGTESSMTTEPKTETMDSTNVEGVSPQDSSAKSESPTTNEVKDGQNGGTSKQPTSGNSSSSNNESNSQATPNVQSNSLPTESADEIAKDVWDGKYGNGLDRKKALGERYKEVQYVVNRTRRANIK